MIAARARTVLVVTLAVLAMTACATRGQAPPEAAAPYAARDLRTGAPVDVAQYRGKVLLLSGWATWCPPCRAELPALDRLNRERRADGLQVIAVNLDGDGPSVREVEPMVARLGISMPQWVDRQSEFRVRFKAVSMPTNVLLGRDGSVLHTWHGAIDPDDPQTAAIIDAALEAPA